MGYDLNGKVAIITGGAGGLGVTIAKAFTAAGCRTALVDTNAAKLAAAVAEIGASARSYLCDITSPGEVAVAAGEIRKDLGSVDILVNNAGIVSMDDILETTPESWKKIMDVNLSGAFYFTQAAGRIMAEQGRGGRIVNIASVAGRNGGIAASPAYSTSKAGLIGLTKASARQLAKHKITVNAVAPGSLDSEMLNSFGKENVASLLKGMPLGRLGTFSDVAGAVLFLVSSEAAFVDGVCLDVNGAQYIAS